MTQYPVLVYGTLRPFGGNYSYFLEGRTVQEQDVTLEGFTMYGDYGFPYLTLGGNTITATLVYIDSNVYDLVLSKLDLLEGYHGGQRPNHYDRILHTFNLNGGEVSAWIYVASPSTARQVRQTVPVLESGDWIKHSWYRQTV